MGRSSQKQTSTLFSSLTDDTFERRDEFTYGSQGVAEHRITFTAKPPAEKKPKSYNYEKTRTDATPKTTTVGHSDKTREQRPADTSTYLVTPTRVLVGGAAAFLLGWYTLKPRAFYSTTFGDI